MPSSYIKDESKQHIEAVVLIDPTTGEYYAASGGAGAGGDASAANQTTIIGHIDGIETLLTSIDSSNSRLTSSAGRKTVGAALATTAFQVGGTYNVTPPTVADTQEVALQVDSAGSLKTVNKGQVLTNVSTTAYAASLVLKASSGILYGLTGYNSKTSGQFIQIHDAAALPADTAVPKLIFYVQAGGNFSLDFGENGRAFAAGIIVCNSSTGPTKTIAASDLWVEGQVL